MFLLRSITISSFCSQKNNPYQFTVKSFVTFLSSLILLTSVNLQANEVHFETKSDQYSLELIAPEQPSLNTIYRWRAILKSSQPLSQLPLSDISISGGMLAHGHGLPTQPKALNLSHDNDHQISFDIEGLKFQMWGNWHVQVHVVDAQAPLIVEFNLSP